MSSTRYSRRRRFRTIFNFISFNLLFFALYLNFIKKDVPVTPIAKQVPQKSALSAAVNAVDPKKGS